MNYLKSAQGESHEDGWENGRGRGISDYDSTEVPPVEVYLGEHLFRKGDDGTLLKRGRNGRRWRGLHAGWSDRLLGVIEPIAGVLDGEGVVNRKNQGQMARFRL